MGMFTNLFSKSHDHYEMKGRWYKISLTPSEVGFEFITTDIPVIDPSSFPNVSFGLAVDPSQPARIGLFKGIILDMKVLPLYGIFASSDSGFRVDMKQNPFPISYFGVSSLTYGCTYDIYLYVVKCDKLPDV